MMRVLRQWFKKTAMTKKLHGFLDEMEKNLESFYVMDQRQFIVSGFSNQYGESLKDDELIKKHPRIKVYIDAINEFNSLLSAYKAFEQWYASSLDHKTQDNAKKLHRDKHELDLKLKTLEAIIIPAGQDLERELLKLKSIRP